MIIYYISPSQMPSRTANSIHVARICEAFTSLGHEVTLFICRTLPESDNLRSSIEKFYGISLREIKLISFYSRWWHIALNLRIALFASCFVLVKLIRRCSQDIIISRNLYAAFFLKRLARRRLLFETHELEYGFRKRIQGAIIKDDAVPKVFISKALYQRLCEHHGYAIQKSIILPDAAHAGVNRLQPQQKVNLRKEHLSSQDLDKYTYHAGYFGHLYSGRGIEIVQALAARHPEIAFWIYGGNDEQITLLKQRNNANNMKVMGYVNPSNVLEIMSMMDVLLMPYQKMVSIGGRNRSDTASYMSPMKMFEYMAAGVPIIASRLPVLEEILIDGQNCLMAVPDDPLSWSGCLDKIKGSEILSEKLAKTAHDEYRQRYTWNVRAQKMIDLIGK